MSGGGQAALITGASGVLGGALVDAFLASGWTVVAGRHRREVRQREGAFRVVPLDARRDEDWAAAATAVSALGVPLGMVVHNAGFPAAGLVARMGWEDWDDAMDSMTRPVVAGTRALLPLMERAGGGHVLAVGSHAMRLGGAGQSAYAAAKAAMVGACRALAAELAPGNIRVNVLLPGLLDGPMLAGLSEEERRRRLSATLLGCPNDPSEVARFAVFLAGTRSVTGQVFAMDSRPMAWA